MQPRVLNGDEPAKKEHQSWGWAYQILPYLELENRWNNPSDDAVRGSLALIYLCPSRDQTQTRFGDTDIGLSHYVANACSNCNLPDQLTGQGAPIKKRSLAWGNSGSSHDGAFPPSPERPRWLEHVRDGLSNTVFIAEKRFLASGTPCNNSTGWVSGSPVIQGNTIYGFDALFSGIEGSPLRDERDSQVQCTSRAGGPHQGGGNVLYGDGSVRFITFGVHPEVWRAQLSISGGEDVDQVNQELLSP
jgi:prepilin-type processing-associated H-X9-DG protein